MDAVGCDGEPADSTDGARLHVAIHSDWFRGTASCRCCAVQEQLPTYRTAQTLLLDCYVSEQAVQNRQAVYDGTEDLLYV